MSKLTVLSYLYSDFSPLGPAPNINETAYISDILSRDTTPMVTDLMAGPLTVLTDHRGVLLFCAGGVTVHRYNPTGTGGNGYFSLPSGGIEEQVIISWNGGRYKAVVRFE